MQKEFKISASGWNDIDTMISKQVGSVVDAVYEDAVRTVPKKSHELERSIKKHFTPGSKEGSVSVGTDHWHATEYGSPPHTIRTSTKKVLTDRNKFFGKEVHHPGTPAQSFMRTALFKNRVLKKEN